MRNMHWVWLKLTLSIRTTPEHEIVIDELADLSVIKSRVKVIDAH